MNIFSSIHLDISGNTLIMYVFISSITEEEPGPLRGDFEKNTTKVGRTFSYLKNKMYKKARVSQRSQSVISSSVFVDEIIGFIYTDDCELSTCQSNARQEFTLVLK